MKITDETEIDEGMVMGFVKTDVVGSRCHFAICSVDEWEDMSEEEAEKAVTIALYESGVMEYGY